MMAAPGQVRRYHRTWSHPRTRRALEPREPATTVAPPNGVSPGRPQGERPLTEAEVIMAGVADDPAVPLAIAAHDHRTRSRHAAPVPCRDRDRSPRDTRQSSRYTSRP